MRRSDWRANPIHPFIVNAMNVLFSATTSLTGLACLAFATHKPCQLDATPAPALTQAASPAALSNSELTNLQAAYVEARFAAHPEGAGLRLQNDSGQLVADLDGRNMTVRPFQGAWSWGLELSSFGFDGAMQGAAERAAVKAEGNRVTYNWTANLDEWFINDARGIEHGYTLRTRPNAGDATGPLTFELDVLGDLRPEILSDASGVRFLDENGSCAMTYTGLTVIDATGATIAARFVPRGQELTLTIDESNAVYPLTIDPMIQLAYIKASNPAYNSQFGSALAVSGNTAVIGAPVESSNSTGVNGNQDNSNAYASGAAYVFVRTGCNWTQQAYLKASNTNSIDRFGSAVAISGNRIVVGAARESSSATNVNGNQWDNSMENAGAAYVFVRNGNAWSQEAYLKASNTEAGDRFGTAVAISGDLIAVGAPMESGANHGVNGWQGSNLFPAAGAAYVYKRINGVWTWQLYLKASNPNPGDGFGAELAMDGTTIAIAARLEDSNSKGVNQNGANNSATDSGAVYVFQEQGGVWAQDAYLKASNTDINDRFGTAVTVSGETVVVGAEFEASAAQGINGASSDNSAEYAGAAYVFSKTGGVWAQEAYLKASNNEAFDGFGCAVSLSGDRLIVGSFAEDSGASGINGDQLDNSMGASGAAYSFIRTNGVWTQNAYLKATNPGTPDHFGIAVGITGDTVLVGARYESSQSSGVNGDQTDNSLSLSGAAYAFNLNSAYGVTQYGSEQGANFADLNSFTPPLVNQFMTLKFADFNNTGVALMMVSAAQANIPMLGGTLLVDPSVPYFGQNAITLVPLLGNLDSYTAFIPPQIAGHTVYVQAAMYDPSLPFEFAFTNGLKISFCP
jgi:hypothetical protein